MNMACDDKGEATTCSAGRPSTVVPLPGRCTPSLGPTSSLFLLLVAFGGRVNLL